MKHDIPIIIESMHNIQDLNIQSSILWLELFYNSRKSPDVTMKITKQTNTIPIDSLENKKSNLTYSYSDDGSKINTDIEDLMYEPFFIPLKRVPDYYQTMMLEFNNIEKKEDRFNHYREVYRKYQKSTRSDGFFMTLDHLEEQSKNKDIYITPTFKRPDINDYNIPEYFTSFDNCCKLNKHGGIDVSIYEDIQDLHISLKKKLLSDIDSIYMLMNEKESENILTLQDIIKNEQLTKKLSIDLYEQIKETSEYCRVFTNFKAENFGASQKDFNSIQIFNINEYKDHLNDDYLNTLPKHSVDNFLQVQKTLQDKHLISRSMNNPNIVNKLKNRL